MIRFDYDLDRFSDLDIEFRGGRVYGDVKVAVDADDLVAALSEEGRKELLAACLYGISTEDLKDVLDAFSRDMKTEGITVTTAIPSVH